jgi:TRAP-type C4-dicarboxylate transport system substrate-binding protein
MNAMGGNGVSMGFDQLINGLQTGVIDGAENNYPTYSSGQHYRYAKYYSRTEHLMIPEILVFSKRIWEELSPEDQELIMRLAKEAQQRQRQLWYAEEEKALADMKAHGVEVVEVADKEALRESVKPVWDKYSGQLGDLVERIQAVQ